MITTVVTVHKVLHKLERTLASLRVLPVKIVVTATGMDEATQRKLRRLCRGCKVVYNPTPYSNAAWIAGVESADTPLSMLLHDGDILSPEFAKYQFNPEAVTIYQAWNITGYHWTHNELCIPNYKATWVDFRRLLSQHNTKTISPGRGVFPTKLLTAALEDFERLSSPSLVVNDSLVIGNDWYIWWFAANQSSAPIEQICQPLIGFDTEESTTVMADHSTHHKLERLYNEVRARVDKAEGMINQRTILTACYTPEIAIGRLRARDLNPTTYTFKFLNFPIPATPSYPMKDIYGAMAFFTALEIAYCHGYDWLYLLEDDIRQYCSNDIQPIADFKPTADTILYGTPTFWNPKGPGASYWQKFVRLAHHFQTITHLPIVPNGNLVEQPSAYTNGALSVYNTKFFYHLMMSLAKRDINLVTPWDLQIGYRLYDIFRERVFDVIQPNYSVFSDGNLEVVPRVGRTLKNYPNILAWHK